jgi:hypothetical protein
MLRGKDWGSLSLGELNQLLSKAENQLQKHLIDGKSWQEVRDQRECINGLSLLIHYRRFPNDRIDLRLIESKLTYCNSCFLNPPLSDGPTDRS